MRKLAASLAALTLAGGAGLVATGCGAEEAAGVDVAQAATKTAAKKTAKVTMTFRGSGMGLPVPLNVTATGVTALDAAKGTLSMDFGPLLQLAGAPAGGASKLEVKFGDGSAVYLKPPAIPGLDIPGGKTWVSADPKELGEAFGFDTKALGALLNVDPSSQLKAFDAAKGLEEVGKEDIDGTETTHYKGTLKLSDYIAALPADQRKSAQDALKQLEALGGGQAGFDDPTPVELWVDDEGVLRRMVSSGKVPGQAGVPGGTFKVDYRLSDFGTPLDLTPPPADDTYDVTDLIKKFGKQLGQSGALNGLQAG